MKAYFEAAPHQARLWWLDRQAGDGEVSTVCLHATLKGNGIGVQQVDALLKEAWQSCQSLRSSLELPDGFAEPLLAVSESAAPQIVVVAAPQVAPQDDWRGRFADEVDKAKRNTRAQLWPQGGAVLAEDTEGTIHISLHHRAESVDGQSLVLLLDTIARQAVGMPGAQYLPFADVAGWLLGTLPPAVVRPHGSPRRDVVRRAMRLPVEHRSLSEAFGQASVEVVLCAAWSALLLRMKFPALARVDVVTSIRAAVGEGAGLGLYSMPRTQQVSIDDDATFDDLVTMLSRDLPLAADMSGFNLPQQSSEFAFEYARTPAHFDVGPLRIEVEAIEQPVSPASLSMICTDTGSSLHAEVVADSAHYPAEVVDVFLNAYASLLKAVVLAPTRAVQSLPLVGEDMSGMAHVDGPSEPVDFVPFAWLVHRAAERYPDHIAVRCADRSWSYRQLDALSWQLAERITAMGVRRGDVVALMMRRSPELMAAILAVSRMGGVFLPLDVGSPASRLDFMLDNARAALILIEPPMAGHASLAGRRSLAVGDDDALFRAADVPAPIMVAPDELAYVLYTSGSTGEPKGVELTHEGLANYLRYAADAYDLTRGRGAIVQSPVTFDLTITALLGPLLVGQTVILIEESGEGHGAGAEVEAVCEELRGGDVTLFKATPSYLKLINQLMPASHLSRAVHSLVVGGEMLLWEVIAPWLSEGRTRVFNEYGPTETVVGSICHEVREDDPRDGHVPIGTPIDHTRIVVLDAQGSPVPAEIFGEICIAGKGVGRGYRNLPDRTRLSFLTVPWIGAGQRLYRTGDLGRIRASGAIELIGRIDTQLKINGVRIEPGEIEALLLEQGSVRAAAVLKTYDGARECLSAYVVPRAPQSLDLGALRTGLAQRLPASMVPGAIMAVERFPLTRNGKLDRAALLALPVLDAYQASVPRGKRLASDKVEAQLSEIWCKILGVAEVGVDEDFFVLGGDSIRSIALVGEARLHGLDITVAQVFSMRTIERLSDACRSRLVRSDSALQPFELLSEADRRRVPEGIEDAYPVATLQLAMIYHNEAGGGDALYHDIFSYHLRFKPDVSLLTLAARQLVRKYEVLRTTFDLVSFEQPIQLVHREGPDLLSVDDLSGLSTQRQEAVIADYVAGEKARRFDIGVLPMMRFMLHLRGDDTVQLTMSFHHALIDGWSDVVILTELFESYFALARNTAPPPAPRTRYAEFVRLEQRAIADPAARAFWQRELEGYRFIPLPPACAPGAGVRVQPISLPPILGERLRAIARAHDLPLKSLLFAVHMKVMALLRDQEDCVSSIVVSGRPETQDGDRMVGLFINSLPVRVVLQDESWIDLARKVLVREQALLEHRRLPLAEIKQIADGSALSETLFYFTHYYIARKLRDQHGIELLRLAGHEASSFKLVANFWVEPFTEEVKASLAADRAVLDEAAQARLCKVFERALELMAASPEASHRALGLELASPQVEPDPDVATVDRMIMATASRTPGATALIHRDAAMSYETLARRADICAQRLREAGVAPGDRVGLCAAMAPEFMVALLAIMRCAAVYVPLAVNQPRARLKLIVEDARAGWVLADRRGHALIDGFTSVLDLADMTAEGLVPAAPQSSSSTARGLAYLSYTSGSTGRPKGVCVSHRSLSSFCSAMSRLLRRPNPAVWLASTSVGFDISMLELLYPLVQGDTVVLHDDTQALLPKAPSGGAATRHGPDFSLFFFSGDVSQDAYELLVECARRADAMGFKAIWTPERHFHSFGGAFPNPAITSAALAMVTRRLQIRAGSLVMPLHDPLRVAEDWAMVDRLSNGRAGMAVASGWHAGDFVLAREPYARRREVTDEGIEVLRRLWRGDAVTVQGGAGAPRVVRTLPRPVQAELPIWLSASGNPQTFERAGEGGLGVLTHLFGQSIEELAANIARYRLAARQRTHVALMLHSYVGATAQEASEVASGALRHYLLQAMDLAEASEPGAITGYGQPQGRNRIVDEAIERYLGGASLIGDIDQCAGRARDFYRQGVDELACLVDFGIDQDKVLESLDRLEAVRAATMPARTASLDDSLAALIERHAVTHFQCTPTLLRELVADPRTGRALETLDVLLVGGEVFPDTLASRLRQRGPARVLHMYGPTEATIWASADELGDGPLTLGAPLANASLHVLDEHGLPTDCDVPGEIHIGGACLAEGYWDNPELTRRVFIDAPSDTSATQRLYRTGDIGLRLADGTIKFLGRKDRQIKSLGQRIELGEIEHVLMQLPAVADCTIVVDDTQLVAAIVIATGHVFSEPALRAFLLDRLPAAMVPSRFVAVPGLPRTANGKLDETAILLAAESGVRRTPDVDVVTAQKPLQLRIAEVWERVLGRAPVDREANFFRSGGNSLKAMVFAKHLSELFQVDVTVRVVFEQPTITALASWIRTHERIPAVHGPDSDEQTDAVHALGFSQSGIWTLVQMSPETVVFNDAMMVDASGPLSIERLRDAVRFVVSRHETLRSRFFDDHGIGRVTYVKTCDFEFELADLRDEPEDARFEKGLTLAREAARTRFDLARGPLLRVFVARIGDRRHQLMLVVHHIVSDGWSLALFLREIAARYADPGLALPPLPLTYGAFVRRQQRQLTPELKAKLLHYWRDQLADLPAPFELPRDFARGPAGDGRGAVAALTIEPGLLAQLDEFAIEKGSTTHILLLCALAVVLMRMSGRTDIVVGTDNANRMSADTQGLGGLLANPLPIRCDLSGNPPFVELLARIHRTSMDAYDHQELPFQMIVAELAPERAIARNPVFQVAFTLQETFDFSGQTFSGMTLEPVPFDIGIARLDLEVNAHRSSSGLTLQAIFNSGLYKSESIDRLLDGMLRQLQGLLADPHRRIGQFDIIGPDERYRLLEGFNQTDVIRDHRSFIECFGIWVERTPDATAVAGNAGTLTYRALDMEARQLAVRLRDAGIEAGEIVAVIGNRDVPLLVSMLALWRLGAVYLPLDPAWPAMRSAALLVEAGVGHVVCSASLESSIREVCQLARKDGCEARLFVMADRLQVVADEPLADIRPIGDVADVPAYVIFTSGSTGRPKGAIVNHRGMMNHMWAKIADLGLDAHDCVAQTAPQTFDIFVWQMLSALLVGARVRIYGDEIAQNPRELIASIDNESVTVLQVVPTFLDLAITAAGSAGTATLFQRLRWLISTGEPLTVALCRRWFSVFPSIPLMNAYGPAECSDDVTHHVLRQMPEPDAVSIPIGRPIGNVRIYILDQHQNLAPMGAAGELCVTGIAVGGGYLNNPQATQRQFVADPFDAHNPGHNPAHRPYRMYRTGDLARWRADGVLEFLGRVDNQVKIRGCRIELGEIEAVLNADPRVRQSVVLAVGEAPAKLVGYVSPDWPAVESFLAAHANRDRTAEWQSIYEFYYQDRAGAQAVIVPATAADPTFDTRGWVDSFSGEAIPAEQMRSWLDHTVARIKTLRPRRILEIGCGTGMLLFRLAPDCERYRGIDFSATVVAQLQDVLHERYPQWRHVEISQCAAHDLDSIDEMDFDCVILNSVVQYFPGEGYLREVLEAAGRKAARGGYLFVGDVRALEMLEPFHRAVQLNASADDLPLAELNERVRGAVMREKELLLSNAFFDRLRNAGGVAGRKIGVHKWLKQGPHDNELVRYRLDVVLALDHAAHALPAVVAWRDAGATIGSLLQRLRETPDGFLLVTGIDNRRLAAQALASECLADDVPPATVGDLRARMAAHPPRETVCPDELSALLTREGYWVQSAFSANGGSEYTFDLLVSRGPVAWPPASESLSAPTSSNPLRNRAQQILIQDLREVTARRLPSYMLPSMLVVLDEMPLLRNGKVNRRALPVVEDVVETTPQHEPRTHAERILCEIWTALLGGKRVGIRTNFFALGGDSILAIQMVSLAAQRGLILKTRQVFRHQTIADLAAAAVAQTNPASTDEPLQGAFPLAPNQAAFFAAGHANVNHWNQGVVLHAAVRLDEQRLGDALRRLLYRHDALRLRFVNVQGRWHQTYLLPSQCEDVPIAFVGETSQAALEEAQAQLHSGLSIEHGPVVRAALQHTDDGRSRILLVAHHLVVDTVSWRIIVDHLSRILSGATTEPDLPPRVKGSSYREWVERQIALAESQALHDHWRFWVEQARVGPAHPIAGRTVPMASGGVREHVIKRTLEGALAGRLLSTEAPLAGASVEEVLLTALALTLAIKPRYGHGDIVVLNEGHGRDLFDELDLSSTVGWFATEYPVRLRVNDQVGVDRQVESVLEQIRFAKRHQIAFGVLRHFSPDASVRLALAELAPPEIAFNYFGRLSRPDGQQALLGVAGAGGGQSRDVGSVRPCAVQLDVLAVDRGLELYWILDATRIPVELVLEVAQAFEGAVETIVDALRDRHQGDAGATDGRFDSVGLDDLGAALSEINE